MRTSSPKEIKEMRERQRHQYDKGEIENIDQFITDNTRQVRWLYHNSNKCLAVVNGKDVRLAISKLKQNEQDRVHLILNNCIAEIRAEWKNEDWLECAEYLIDQLNYRMKNCVR